MIAGVKPESTGFSYPIQQQLQGNNNNNSEHMEETKELIKQKINELNKTNQSFLNLNGAVAKVDNNTTQINSSNCSSISSSVNCSLQNNICHNIDNNNNPYNGYFQIQQNQQQLQQQQHQFQAMSYQQNMLPNPGHVLHQQFPVQHMPQQHQYQMAHPNPMQYNMNPKRYQGKLNIKKNTF